ncbi:conserved exported hypothetical protein [uncultured Desulfatiglans sp.]|nr:conserved exported hypothetical protein [uncultured Desulfatiglans sp.]
MMKRKAGLLTALVLALLFCHESGAEEAPAFDLSEIEREVEKKPYAIHGFLQAQPTLSGLDRDSSLYRLRFFREDPGATAEESDVGARLEGTLHYGNLSAFARVDSFLAHDYNGWDGDMTLMEGYLSFKPAPRMTLEAGKRVTKWGKGYAWNPVAFVDRPKNPEDPEEALEGYTVLAGDFIRSLAGPLQTLAFTPVLLPVYEDLNDDFGKAGHVNLAAKLYALLWDTDLDLLFFTGASRTTRWGFDFSKNLLPQFEIHGEAAWVKDFPKKSFPQAGQAVSTETDVWNYLLGIRYLTQSELTVIFEYYHNGEGVDPDDLDNLYASIDDAYDAYQQTGDPALFGPVKQLVGGGFTWRNPLEDYLYLRLIQKEPFDILYLNPACTIIAALNDGSFNLIPELSYSPVTNLELRLRSVLPVGGNKTEYGEKQSDWRVEFRLRYFF